MDMPQFSDGHLGSLPFLTIVNMAMHVQVLCRYMFSLLLAKYLVVECLGHIIALG